MILALVFHLLTNTSHATQIRSDTGATAYQFANIGKFNSRLDQTLQWTSESQADVDMRLPAREIQLKAFYEFDEFGDYSFDPDPIALRAITGSPNGPVRGHLWWGRAHPLRESERFFSRNDLADRPFLDPVTPYDAVGSKWAQNQSDALQPQVSGWAGLGWHVRHQPSGLRFTLAYSHFFLPSFGPSLVLTEDNPASGSRYSRLPPLYANVDGNVFPMRYSINPGRLNAIVLQPQGMSVLGWENESHSVDALYWSAPSPSPQVDPQGRLKIHNDQVNVLVTAVPRFPRQQFVGLRYRLFPIQRWAELMAVYETTSNDLTASVQFHPFEIVSVGGLHRFEAKRENTSGIQLDSPQFDRKLVWVHVGKALSESLYPSLMLTQHLEQNRSGTWMSPRLRWNAWGRLSVTTRADLIAGQDRSYLGTWRHLDSVRVTGEYRL